MTKIIGSILGSVLLLALLETVTSYIPSHLVGISTTSRKRLHISSYGTDPADFAFRTLHCSRRQRSSILFMSSTSKETRAPRTRVLYQKVIRPSPDLPDVMFLGYLVEYLQDHFDLPPRLPMVYEKSLPPDDEDNDTPQKANRYVVSWDSSLSPSSEATRMDIEVVGIYTDESDGDNKSSSAVPNMAMVVVHKDPSSNTASKALPAMLQNLFTDSEKRILKALDRGLDDFVAGKIKFNSVRPDPLVDRAQSAQDAMIAELMDDGDGLTEMKAGRSLPSDVMDADIVVVKPDEKEGQARTKKDGASLSLKKEAVLRSMNAAADGVEVEVDTTQAKGLDFAVQAAKRAAAKRQTKKEDFAVAAAAKKAAASSPQSKTPESEALDTTNPSEDIDPLSIDMSSIRSPILEQNAGAPPRAFMKTISTPKARMEKNSAKGSKKEQVSSKATVSTDSAEQDTRVSETNSVNDASESSLQRNARKRSKGSDPPDGDAGSFNAAKQDTMDDEMNKATLDILEELAHEGKEMTPEELLADVLKFGEQEEKENSEGGGFVSGAFEKAKEILVEQKLRRDERIQKNVIAKVTAEMQGLAPDIADAPKQRFLELSPEEELRQMFEAGERIAEGRITMKTSSDIAAAVATGAADEELDSIIAQDRSVSGHARILDEELAELEVRINKSPGEEFDSPAKNPRFDIFTGPEVYNPNVDPETSVNWPGARPGTKSIRLPKELDEAVSQAKFAVEVLASLEESEATETAVKRYFVGERELTQQQVDNLRTVVAEAAEIGIITDPLTLMSERSRLQMLLDELWHQPEERMRDITSSYKDLLLSDNFVSLVKERLTSMADRDLEALRQDDDSLESAHSRERELLGQLVVNAQLLLKETKALGAELEAQQLEVIRSICKVAMDPSHQTEEETATALTAVVRDMRPLLDEGFVAYLKYAVAEEEGRLARAGVLDDPEHNQWLFVLKVVQQGVYAEIAQGINRYIDHVWYVLRMETAAERRMLLKKLIDVMPTLDVRPFVQVVENIAGSLGDSAEGEFSEFTALGEMTNKILQLHRDTKELLPPERIALMSRDADEWAAERKRRFLEQQNLTRQRLKAARQTEHLDGEIESLGRRGEMERIE
jgi:hypothetical protein